MDDTPHIRLAEGSDALKISMLYHQVYEGQYSDSLMRNPQLLQAFINDRNNVWVVAEHKGEIIGSVVYEVDRKHRIAKTFGGVVLAKYRGARLLEKAMVFGQKHLTDNTLAVDVIYATTRTSTPAPQIVTERLGYRKLGIFPNVHKTSLYETHCLTAWFTRNVFDLRVHDFHIHPRIRGLFEIVREECKLPEQAAATEAELHLDAFDKVLDLELIAAPLYVANRFASQKQAGHLPNHFYPFHAPNVVISSPCLTIEIFIYMSMADKYCTIIGVKKPREYSLTQVLEKCMRLLQEQHVRYIELLVRADKIKTIERVALAGFIPCAYFPAFQLIKERRYDFAVFSRTFEIVDFRGLKLTGKNILFLENYVSNLRDAFLKPQLVINRPGSVP